MCHGYHPTITSVHKSKIKIFGCLALTQINLLLNMCSDKLKQIWRNIESKRENTIIFQIWIIQKMYLPVNIFNLTFSKFNSSSYFIFLY